MSVKLLPMGRMRLAAALLILAGSAMLGPSSSAAPADRFFDSNGVRIRFVDIGQGEPVILIHGFLADLESWNRGEILASLARDYRVVALDCRGHGKSDKPHDSKMYGIQMGNDVLGLMDHLGIRRAHLVGYSMGARIIGYLMAKNPDRMITATFGASPPRRTWNEADREQARRFSADVARIAKSAGFDSSSQDFTALSAVPLGWRQQVVTDDELAAAGVPGLAIVGSEDSRLMQVKALEGVIPSLERVVVVDGATHSGERATPKDPVFLRALQAFLSSHRVK